MADLLTPATLRERQERLRVVGLADGEGIGWLLGRAEELLHTDPPTAEALLDIGRAEAGLLTLPVLEGRAGYLRARLLAERGDLEEALIEIVAAQQDFESGGEALMAARTDLGRMHILDELGRHSDAVNVGESLLDRLPQITHLPEEADLKAMIAAAALGNCGVAYGFLGQHVKSLEAYEHAEAGYAALGMTDEVAQWQANSGIELLSLGEAHRAAEVLAAAAESFGAAGDDLWQAKCQVHLAEAQQVTGDIVGALATLATAQDVLERLGAAAELARVHLQKGRAYLDAGLLREAITAAGQAIETTAATGMLTDQGKAWYISGLARLATGDLEQGEQDLGSADELFREVGAAQDQARVLLARGELLARGGERSAAAATFVRAVRALRGGGWLIPAGWGLVAAYDVADTTDARASLLEEAASLSAELALPDLTVAVSHRRARLLRERGDHAGAARELRRARSRIEQLGSALHEPSLLMAFSSAKRPVSDELVSLLAAEGGPEAMTEAIAVSDQAKAQTLADLVAGTIGNRSDAVGGPDGSLTRRRAELSGMYAALQAAPDAARREVVRRRADELEAVLVDEHVRRSGPAADDVRRSDGSHILSTGGSRMPGIAFHVTGDDIVAFVVADQEVRGVVLPGAYPTVRRLVAGLAAQWARFRMGRVVRQHEAMLMRTTQALLGDLHDVLLAPLRHHFDLLSGDRIVVAPDRLLHRVPFPALYDRDQHLIERWAVTLSPTTLVRTLRLPAPAPTGQQVVVVGVPDARAPHIEAEACGVADRVPGATLLLGEEATVDSVASAAAAATHLHLACHGMYRAENPLFSSLRLADRWWTCSEVLDLDLTGAHVVLTACESGRSDDTAEPVGLAWGFLATGARSAVVSQWLLDDAVSVELTSAYYERLRAGEDVAHALRAAQLAVRVEHPHPYYWGSLVHVASPFEHRADKRS